MVSNEQIAQMRKDGFTTFDRLIDEDALTDLRTSYDRILSGEIDCGDDYRMLGGITKQVMSPSRHLPSLQANAAFVNAQKVACDLLGCDAAYLFDMMIFKPAGHPESTPWHQDLSYFAMPYSPAGTMPLNATLQFWIAVDDADVENGCMHFVPEAHTAPLREHYVCSGAEDYEGRLLAIRNPEADLDLDRVVPCPLPAGGATVHYEGTPHFTPPNTSPTRGRRAYIVNFRDPSR